MRGVRSLSYLSKERREPGKRNKVKIRNPADPNGEGVTF
jgi:hypothetical protein